MARNTEDFRDLLLDILKKIGDIQYSTDVQNDPAAMNRLTSMVSYLEAVLLPYANKGRNTVYNPPETGDKYQDIYWRIAQLVKVGKATALFPTRRLNNENVSDFKPPTEN